MPSKIVDGVAGGRGAMRWNGDGDGDGDGDGGGARERRSVGGGW